MMKILAAFVMFSMLVQAVVTKDFTLKCKGVYFDGKYHIEQLLKADVYHPASLAVDDDTKTLYFSYLQLFYLEFRTVRLDLTTKLFNRIDVYAGSAITVDQKRHQVYIGGPQGLYEFNAATNETNLILPDADVWRMHFKEVLYYIEFISYSVYKYFDDMTALYEELAGIKVYFFAKEDDYMVYSNETGVYSKMVGADSVLLKDLKNADVIKEITLDREGSFFVLAVDGIYKVDRTKQTLEKVSGITDAYGMTFDTDNQLIYSREASVVRLLPTKNCKI